MTRYATYISKSNNIDVDPYIVCHAEQSEASLFNAVLRSIDFSPYGRRPSVHIRYSLKLIKHL